MRYLRWFAVVLLICLAPFCAAAQEMFALLPVTSGSVEILPTQLGGENWLFLPSFASADTLSILIDGEAVRFTPAPANEEGAAEWQLEDGSALHVMQSAHLRTVFLFSDDPVNAGREYIEACENHENETTGSMALIDAQGLVDHADRLRQIRGRGNGTWDYAKRPYQIKLEERADLLDTGIAEEASRTWVLLAEATDLSFLHNKAALDLGLEIGLAHTPRSEYVDLYYDGQYRGLYLLAEKVEIGSGRVDELDYDDLLEEWNDQIGQTDLEALPVGEGVNSYGNPFTYIQGVADNEDPGAGAYLLELESPLNTLSDRCWFAMSDGVVFASKNPENASESMMRYISQKLQSARITLQNGGVNPENGRTTADEFDVDSFARLALVGELAYNIDSFTYSSTWFVLPAGSDRFKAGPVWDFDLAWRYLSDGSNARARGLKKHVDWALDFYSDPTFVNAMRSIWVSEVYPLVENVLLGTQEGAYLKPLAAYAQLIEPSRRMNAKIWATHIDSRLVYAPNAQADQALMAQFIRERSAWLNECFTGNWQPDTLALTFSTAYGYADTQVSLSPLPWPHITPVYHVTQLSEATEDSYARYRVDVYLSLADWSAFADPTPVVNGTRLSYQILDDGRMHFVLTFEDITYRPVEYYGDDIGMVYNYDYYVQNHPEVLEYCGDDPEAVMEYFCEEGMYEGHVGNAYFDPARILQANPRLMDMFGEDWALYYWDFIYYGYDDGWLKNVGAAYQPPVADAE